MSIQSEKLLVELKRASKQYSIIYGHITHTQALDKISTFLAYKNWALLHKDVEKSSDAAVRIHKSMHAHSALKMLLMTKAEAFELMRNWVSQKFTPLVEFSPYETREGGYLYPSIELDDVLGSEFGGSLPDEWIIQAAFELEEDGPWGIEENGHDDE
jgi:hypothetical protein